MAINEGVGAIVEEVSFGYKTAWLAIRTEAGDSVARALGLRSVVPSAPAPGIQKSYDWDPSGPANPIFVTPAVYGWVLCVGQALFAYADPGSPDFGDLVTRLSAELQCDVEFFCTHRVVESHGWARAAGGKLVRAYLYVGESGQTVVNDGAPTADELHLGFAAFAATGAATRAATSYPSEDDVIRLAGRWSVDPLNLPAMSDGLLGDLPNPSLAPRRPAGRREAAPTKKPWWKRW